MRTGLMAATRSFLAKANRRPKPKPANVVGYFTATILDLLDPVTLALVNEGLAMNAELAQEPSVSPFKALRFELGQKCADRTDCDYHTGNPNAVGASGPYCESCPYAGDTAQEPADV